MNPPSLRIKQGKYTFSKFSLADNFDRRFIWAIDRTTLTRKQSLNCSKFSCLNKETLLKDLQAGKDTEAAGHL